MTEADLALQLVRGAVDDVLASLALTNSRAREADDDPPIRTISTRCASCSAGIYSLTCVDLPDGSVRYCRKCRTSFELGWYHG